MIADRKSDSAAGARGLQVDIANSVAAIGSVRWHGLSRGGDVPDYAYMETLEDSGLAFKPLYAIAWDESGIRGIMFGGLWHLRFAPAVRLRVFTTGTPLNVGSPLLLAVDDCCGSITSALMAAMRSRARRDGARLFVARDFAERYHPALPSLSTLYDCAVLDIAWDSFEAYVQSRPKRKSIRRDMKSVATAGYRLEIQSGEALSNAQAARIHSLWRQIYDKHRSFDQLYITERFFANCARLPQAVFFLLYRADTIFAFDLCFVRGDVLESTYCGVDLVETGRLSVHRTMGYEIVRYAIGHGYRQINFGISNAAVKQEAGCRLEPLYGRIDLLPDWLDRACGHPVRRLLARALHT